MKDEFRIEHLTSGEIREKFNRGFPHIIVNIGSIEQQGPYLPINTDYLLTEALEKGAVNFIVKPVCRGDILTLVEH